ncbi:hypothetical protein ACLOJK_020842, partial [Asimina triloba]
MALKVLSDYSKSWPAAETQTTSAQHSGYLSSATPFQIQTAFLRNRALSRSVLFVSCRFPFLVVFPANLGAFLTKVQNTALVCVERMTTYLNFIEIAH